jgi:hypothetical protein
MVGPRTEPVHARHSRAAHHPRHRPAHLRRRQAAADRRRAGRSIKNFKRASSGQDELEVSKKDQLEAKKASRELDAGEVEDAEVVTKAKAKKA